MVGKIGDGYEPGVDNGALQCWKVRCECHHRSTDLADGCFWFLYVFGIGPERKLDRAAGKPCGRLSGGTLRSKRWRSEIQPHWGSGEHTGDGLRAGTHHEQPRDGSHVLHAPVRSAR